MSPFTFFKFVSGRTLNTFEIEVLDNFEMAKTYAEQLLRQYAYDAVEIFDGDQSVTVRRCDRHLS